MKLTKPTRYDIKATSDLAHALEDLPDNYLACRDMRHSWGLEKDFYVENSAVPSKGNIRRLLLCMRCGMERVERYVHSKWGLEKVGQTYHQPDGYKITGVPRGNKPANIVQAEQYRRAMNRIAEQSRRSS